MSHGLRWCHKHGSCERYLYLHGIIFGHFCDSPGGNIDFFVLDTPEGSIKTPPSVKQTKRIAEAVAKRWRRRFRSGRFPEINPAEADEDFSSAVPKI